MKVCLLSAVPKLGPAGAVMNVADAYARNFLLPQKLARIATAADEQRQTRSVDNQSRAIATKQKALQNLRQVLHSATLEITAPANETGTLFAGIHAQDIVKAAKSHGWKLDHCHFEPEVVKQIGQHTLAIRWPDGVASTIRLHITHA